MNTDIHFLGSTNARPPFRQFGIKPSDRLSHLYIVGKTGVGKTTLLENLIIQDIKKGNGCALLDPHGDMVERINSRVTSHWEIDNSKVVYLNAPDERQPYGYNPVRPVNTSLRPLLASGMLEVFKKLWNEAWGVRMEHIFRNVLHTLLDQPVGSLADIPRLLTNEEFRNKTLHHVSSSYVREFWEKEFASYRGDAIAPILNKVGGFLANPTLSRILTEPPENLSLRQIMDKRQVLLVNLSKGRLGEDASSLLGGLIFTSLGLSAFSRADMVASERLPFHTYVDEFQNFTTLALVNMTSELRKYGMSLTLAHQYLSQLKPDIRSAVLGNIGTLIVFRVGAEDARPLAKQFEPVFRAVDLLNLPNHEYYIKLMIEGAPSSPFSARALPPMSH